MNAQFLDTRLLLSHHFVEEKRKRSACSFLDIPFSVYCRGKQGNIDEDILLSSHKNEAVTDRDVNGGRAWAGPIRGNPCGDPHTRVEIVIPSYKQR